MHVCLCTYWKIISFLHRTHSPPAVPEPRISMRCQMREHTWLACKIRWKGVFKNSPFHQGEQLGLTGSFTPFLTQKTSHGPYGFALIFSSMSRGKAMCTRSHFCRFSSLTQMAHKSWDCSHHCCESESLLALEYRSSESEGAVTSTEISRGCISILWRFRYETNSTSENLKDQV